MGVFTGAPPPTTPSMSRPGNQRRFPIRIIKSPSRLDVFNIMIYDSICLFDQLRNEFVAFSKLLLLLLLLQMLHHSPGSRHPSERLPHGSQQGKLASFFRIERPSAPSSAGSVQPGPLHRFRCLRCGCGSFCWAAMPAPRPLPGVNVHLFTLLTPPCPPIITQPPSQPPTQLNHC